MDIDSLINRIKLVEDLESGSCRILQKIADEFKSLRTENARLRSVNAELQKRFMDTSVDRNLLQGVIDEANANDDAGEPLVYIKKNTREWIDTVKPFMSARFEMQFRTDNALEEYCIPLYARPIPAQQSAYFLTPSCAAPLAASSERSDRCANDLLGFALW